MRARLGLGLSKKVALIADRQTKTIMTIMVLHFYGNDGNIYLNTKNIFELLELVAFSQLSPNFRDGQSQCEKIQDCKPRCKLWVGASLEKTVQACELLGSGQARCHPYCCGGKDRGRKIDTETGEGLAG